MASRNTESANKAKTDETLTAGTGGIVEDAKKTAGHALDTAKEKAGPLLDQAQEKIGEVTEQAQHQAKSQLSAGKDRAAEGIDTVALALRHTGEQLEDEKVGPLGDYVSKAANKLSDVSLHLRQSDVNELLRETESFARRESALFLGGAFALGLMAARFLKSSNQQSYDRGQYQDQSSGYDQGSSRYTGGEYSTSDISSMGGISTGYGTSGTSGVTSGTDVDAVIVTTASAETLDADLTNAGTSGVAEEL